MERGEPGVRNRAQIRARIDKLLQHVCSILAGGPVERRDPVAGREIDVGSLLNEEGRRCRRIPACRPMKRGETAVRHYSEIRPAEKQELGGLALIGGSGNVQGSNAARGLFIDIHGFRVFKQRSQRYHVMSPYSLVNITGNGGN